MVFEQEKDITLSMLSLKILFFLILIEVKLKDQSLRDSLKNFFLHDLENMIKETFVTELSKEFSIYILITFSGENKKNKKLDLINPSNN